MKRTLRPKALLLLTGAMLCASPIVAQTEAPPPPPAQTDAPPPPPPGGPHHGGPERRVEMLQHSLNLTPDQTTQVQTLLTGERGKMEALRSNTALSQDDRHTQMMAIHQDTTTKMHSILTPDQATKYDTMEAQMREHRREGGGPPPPPPSPPPSPNQ